MAGLWDQLSIGSLAILILARFSHVLATVIENQPGPPDGCLIKGNINSEGVRIYHLPGTRDYDITVIRVEDSERWFCTEAEAVAASWRAPR